MSLFLATTADELSQGDVFAPDWDADLGESIGRVIVLNNDCDIDKIGDGAVLVARVVTPDSLDRGRWGHVLAGRVWHLIHLEGLQPEAAINLREIHMVSRVQLLQRLDRRTQSASEEGKLLLAVKFFGFLTRSLPPTEAPQS